MKRVNFLHHGKYALTYRNLGIVFGLWLALCVGVEVLLMGYGWIQARRLDSIKTKVQVLQKKQDEQLQILALTKTQTRTDTSIQSLSGVFHVVPRWSRSLNALLDARPPQIDLLRYASKSGNAPAERKLELNGYASNAEAMATFVDRLSGLPAYRNVFLTDSSRDDQQGGKLKFTIAASVDFAKLPLEDVLPTMSPSVAPSGNGPPPANPQSVRPSGGPTFSTTGPKG